MGYTLKRSFLGGNDGESRDVFYLNRFNTSLSYTPSVKDFST